MERFLHCYLAMRVSILPAGLGLAAALACAAGQPSLFPLSPIRLGGHGGPHFKLTTLEGRTALVGGGILALSTNPGFSWLVSANYLEADVDGLEFGYGAVGCEAVFRYRRRVQPMAQFQAGYGLADRNGETGHGVVVEGAALLGFQVGRGEKIILGLGYREAEVHGVTGLSMSELDGWSLNARLDYGIFDPAGAGEGGWATFTGFYSGKWTRLDGQWAWLDGGGTTVILGRRFALGAGGYRSRNGLSLRGQDFSLGYGGLLARYLASPARRVHAAFSLLAGGGGAGFLDAATGKTVAGGLPVLDADVLAEFNVTEFLRVGLGAGYRFVPVGFRDLGPWDLGGPTVTVQFATGAF